MVHQAVQRGKRVIFAVHGKALVHDMSGRVAKLGIEHGVLMGGQKRERWHPVQVASIDTLHRMPHLPDAQLVIVDEAHMSLSPTWRKTLDRFPHAKIVGMTATPIRLDGKGLGSETGGIFDFMVEGPTENALIEMGYLVKSRVLAPPEPEGVEGVDKTGGDFNTKQLAAACDKVQLVGDVVEHWLRHAPARKTAAFGVDQKHAHHIMESFRARGIQWAYVDAETPDGERDVIWKDLDAGCLMGVSSVGCISVGWDHPVVSCLIAARPTASLGLWRQMLGRGSRPYKGKDHFLVLDHAGNTHRHDPYGMFEDEVPWSLDGQAVRAPKDAEKEEHITTCDKPRIVAGVMRFPCYFTFRSGPDVCPNCGLPLLKKERKIETRDGELTEVVRERKSPEQLAEEAAQWREKHVAFMDLIETCKTRGYKFGWISITFQRTYGHWPPRTWIKEAQRLVDSGVEEVAVNG